MSIHHAYTATKRQNYEYFRCDKKAFTKQGGHAGKEEYHAYVACCYDYDEEVVKFAETLKQDLTRKGYKCISDEGVELGKSTIDTICSKIEMSQRIVLVISKRKLPKHSGNQCVHIFIIYIM